MIKVHTDKIRDIIGKGGATIRSIVEETGAEIDIDDDGTVRVYADNQSSRESAINRINEVSADAEVGKVYSGKVSKVVEFGAFVNILPGRDGLLHISQIANERVEKVSDYLEEGQAVDVLVTEVDQRWPDQAQHEGHCRRQLTPIDHDLARRLVADSFPQWAHLAVTPVDHQGHDNRTFRLGDAMSLRLPSGEAYAAHIGAEYEWLPRLAPHLPVAVPLPLGLGNPSQDYPWNWLVNCWIQGASGERTMMVDGVTYAKDLASFLRALHSVDTRGGPVPSAVNFYRGGSLQVYANEALDGMRRVLHGSALQSAHAILRAALEAPFVAEPVWVHGDLVADNTIISEGRCCGVIDFGQLAIGDPACDLTIAWTFLNGEARSVFKELTGFDEGTWCRARGWALWKALIEMQVPDGRDTARAEQAKRVVGALISESEQRPYRYLA